MKVNKSKIFVFSVLYCLSSVSSALAACKCDVAVSSYTYDDLTDVYVYEENYGGMVAQNKSWCEELEGTTQYQDHLLANISGGISVSPHNTVYDRYNCSFTS